MSSTSYAELELGALRQPQRVRLVLCPCKPHRHGAHATDRPTPTLVKRCGDRSSRVAHSSASRGGVVLAAMIGVIKIWRGGARSTHRLAALKVCARARDPPPCHQPRRRMTTCLQTATMMLKQPSKSLLPSSNRSWETAKEASCLFQICLRRPPYPLRCRHVTRCRCRHAIRCGSLAKLQSR